MLLLLVFNCVMLFLRLILLVVVVYTGVSKEEFLDLDFKIWPFCFTEGHTCHLVRIVGKFLNLAPGRAENQCHFIEVVNSTLIFLSG